MKRVLVLGVLWCATVGAAGNLPEVETRTESSVRSVLSLSERVTRLEQQTGSPNTTLQLTQRVEALQQEVQELRGMVEDIQNRLQQSTSQNLQHTPAVAAATSTFAEAAPAPEGEKGLYQTAYQQLQARDYQTASHTLHSLLEKYPNGENAPDAYYWLGEVALIQGKTEEAQKYFETVVSKYPAHIKVGDSLLKMGYIAYSNEDYPLSKQLLDKVMKQYPGSSAARLAEARIQKMKKAGQL